MSWSPIDLFSLNVYLTVDEPTSKLVSTGLGYRIGLRPASQPPSPYLFQRSVFNLGLHKKLLCKCFDESFN